MKNRHHQTSGLVWGLALVILFSVFVDAEEHEQSGVINGLTIEFTPQRKAPDSALSLLQEGTGGETHSIDRSVPATDRSDNRIFSSSAVGDRTLYLTFDDGPVDGTENVIRVLSEEGVEATMFCVGRHAQKRRRLFRRELQMPNLMIANHTFSHADGRYSRFYSDLWKVMSDVEHAQLILGGRKYLRLAGRNVWRVPEVRRNDGALSSYRRGVEIPKYDLLAREGFFIYGWDVEWRFDHTSGKPLQSAEALAEKIESFWRHRRTVRQGKVVLLAHDFMFRDSSSTEELRRFVQIMKRRGWRFRKIGHYSASRPEPLYFAKYYGKKAPVKLADAASKHGKRAKVSNAYRPLRAVSTQTTIAGGQRTPTSTALSLQAQLNEAIRHYESARVDRLVRQGARINRRDEYGRLALNTAIRANSIHLVKKLLNLGADLRVKDGRGYTALAAARTYRRPAIERYLIEYSLQRGVKHIAALDEKEQKVSDPLQLLRQ